MLLTPNRMVRGGATFLPHTNTGSPYRSALLTNGSSKTTRSAKAHEATASNGDDAIMLLTPNRMVREGATFLPHTNTGSPYRSALLTNGSSKTTRSAKHSSIATSSTGSHGTMSTSEYPPTYCDPASPKRSYIATSSTESHGAMSSDSGDGGLHDSHPMPAGTPSIPSTTASSSESLPPTYHNAYPKIPPPTQRVDLSDKGSSGDNPKAQSATMGKIFGRTSRKPKPKENPPVTAKSGRSPLRPANKRTADGNKKTPGDTDNRKRAPESAQVQKGEVADFLDLPDLVGAGNPTNTTPLLASTGNQKPPAEAR
jgi:hypothetical protein